MRSITSTVVAPVMLAACMTAFPVVQAADPPPASDSQASVSRPLDAQFPAHVVPKPAPVARHPQYKWLRFEEDWSFLRDADPRNAADFWDRIKYVPLSENGSIWASFGGQMRMRLESWQNFLFGAPPNDDDTFLLWRLLLHADVHVGRNLRFFVQGKSALSTERDLPGGNRSLDVDSIALEQMFYDLEIPIGDVSLTFRPGRQQYLFGKQRLVSPLPWANTLRRWDGITAILKAGGWRADGFYSQFVPVREHDFNRRDAQTEFIGVHARGPLATTDIGLELYFLGLRKDHLATFNGTIGFERRYTVGGHLFSGIGKTPLDYDFEGAYQFGEVGPGDVDGFMIGTELGIGPPGWWAAPRFYVGFDFGSGDRSPGGDVQTFNQLFPLAHAYLGYIDLIGRQNIIAPTVGGRFTPFKHGTFQVQGLYFIRHEEADALYGADGRVVRSGSPGSSRDVGAEIDITFGYGFDKHLTTLLGYSIFIPGDFIEQTGASQNIHFLYAQLTYTF